MAFLQAGITENLKFDVANLKINDKGTLELAFTSAADGDSMDAILAAIENNETLDTVQGKLFLWTPNIKKKDKESGKEVARTFTEILSDLLNMRRHLLHYGFLYGPEADATAAYGGNVMFEGLGKEVRDLVPLLVQEALLKAVYTKLVKSFEAFIKSRPNLDSTIFRHKFWRKSDDEHFATLPMLGSFGTHVESMSISKAVSALTWSKFEIDNGKNNPIPVAPDKVKGAGGKAKQLYGSTGAPAKSSVKGLI
ncbi:MAG: hypothetical protein KAH32_05790 [Chlamydiia bacterium]|nr:hypothetical protein [Chlamydiia bacterium]